MAAEHSKSRRIREQSLLEEPADRDGHWMRDFTSRSIVWPIIEHWTAENRLHLIALRSNRRLYQRGEDGQSFVTYVEIRQDASRVRVKAWTVTSFRARALRLFLLGSEVPVDPGGWIALRYRRKICHILNDLLERLGQPPILHSRNFHPIDLDLTTLALGSSLLWSSALLAYRSALSVKLPKWPWKIEVVDLLTSSLALPAGVLTATAFLLVGLHELVVVRRVAHGWMKLVSLAAGLAIVLGMTLGIARVTGPGILAKRLTVECVQSYDAEVCGALTQAMPVRERYDLANRIRLLHKELIRR